jgi:PAS domain S-box-containing protein
VGVDIEIDHLSTFIGRLRIGKNGRAFMMNSNGDVVAFPDLEKIRFTEGQQRKIRLVTIEEIDDGLSQAAFHAIDWQRDENGLLQLKKARFSRFDYGGQSYHVMFAPFNDDQWPWIIGVYVPESDYIGVLKENRRNNILITMVLSLLATALGLWLARGIIRPLSGLEKEAQAIKKNDLTQKFDTHSIYKELQETADSFACMKEAIRSGEEKYRTIFENIQDIYYENSLDGTLLEVSPSVEKITSYTRQELIGSPITRLYKDPQDRLELMKIITAEGRVVDHELVLNLKNGSVEYCSINAMLQRDADGRPEKIIGSLRVITDRKKAEMKLRQYQEYLQTEVDERTRVLKQTNEQLRREIDMRREKERQLRKSEEKYRSIIENMENGYFEIDLAGNLTFCNRPLADILGYAPEEIPGLNYRQYLDADTASAVAEKFDAIRRTGVAEKFSRYTVIRKDGGRRILETSATLISDSAGCPVGFRGVVLDVTEKLAAERERKELEQRVQQIQRLESIGKLAGGVAHDFNNLLMGIQGNVSLILLETDRAHAHYDKLKSIEATIQTGADLTGQLLGFARGGKYMTRPVDINKTVQRTLKMFGRTRKEVKIVEKMQKNLWTVIGDQSQIEQVLLNILINAWQAMPGGGYIYIETGNITLDNSHIKTFEIKPGRFVQISISDTGVGIEEAVQHKIFEPFFTTKEMGRGTGLGLASSYGVIKNHGGAIDFNSQPGRGTSFYIYLPASDAVVMHESSVTLEQVAMGTETILLVDDEKMILEANAPLLEKLGYTVLTARSGEEAVDVYSHRGDEIDLVVLDMIMPGLGGSEVFERLKALKPEVKVLLSSGYSLSGQAESILARGCAGFIQKPFDVEKLSRKLRQVLES